VQTRSRLLVSIAALALVVAGFPAEARAQSRLSPHESVSATVDGSDISITYGRPYMRGRAIMGALVPYGRVWCPGADEATALATSRGLRIGGRTLAAGRYTLWMLPTADLWMLIINKQTGQFHTEYDARQDLWRVDLEKRVLGSPVDQLTFSIVPRPGGGGVIKLAWETTEVSVPFTVSP